MIESFRPIDRESFLQFYEYYAIFLSGWTNKHVIAGSFAFPILDTRKTAKPIQIDYGGVRAYLGDFDFHHAGFFQNYAVSRLIRYQSFIR